MNPDGYEESYNSDITPKPYVLGRKNANNVDLNRDFPNLDKLACLLPTGLRSDHLTQAWLQKSDKKKLKQIEISRKSKLENFANERYRTYKWNQ